MNLGLIRLVVAPALLVLPGAWIAFAFPLRQLSGVARLAVAGVLSPGVVALEFYLVRLLGVAFAPAAWVVLLLNAGSAWLVIRTWRKSGGWQVSARSLAAAAGIYLVLAACAAYPWMASENTRIFTGHSWMHMGIIYQFPSGRLIPEEPEMAGVRLAYPWLGHLYWAVLSWVLDWAPTRTYVLTNLIWLAWVCVLVFEICRALGASRFASRVALLWMGLGTNVAGSLLWVGANWGLRMHIRMPGDIRATPWVRKFTVLELMPFALGLFAALVLTGMKALQTHKSSWLAVALLLLLNLGLIYPVIFPAAVALCGVLGLLMWFDKEGNSRVKGRWTGLAFVLGVFLASAVALIHLKFLTGARAAPTLVFSPPLTMLAKAASSILAMGLFLVVLPFLPRKDLWRRETLFLLAGALASLLCRILIQAGAGGNEYKFLFCAALCLAPVACRVLDPWVPQKVSPALVLVASVLLVIPAFPAIRTQLTELHFSPFPRVNDRSFWIRLAPEEPAHSWVETLRLQTPPETVVVLNRCALFVPAATGRSLLAPCERQLQMPGYGGSSEYILVKERGYSTSLFQARRELQRRVFEDDARASPAELLTELKRLRRPVAFVFSPGEGHPFLAWAQREHQGRLLLQDGNGAVVWFLAP